jgi:hypothetical protein
MNFLLLKSILENDVSLVLDIEAHIVRFSRGMRLILPDVLINMIEPNPLCEEHLKLIEGRSYLTSLLVTCSKAILALLMQLKRRSLRTV